MRFIETSSAESLSAGCIGGAMCFKVSRAVREPDPGFVLRT
jgi:hypothetical protein